LLEPLISKKSVVELKWKTAWSWYCLHHPDQADLREDLEAAAAALEIDFVDFWLYSHLHFSLSDLCESIYPYRFPVRNPNRVVLENQGRQVD